MIPYFETSTTYKVSLWVRSIFDNSYVKKVCAAIGSWYQSSTTHRVIYNYFNRKSSYQYTLTYRFLSAIGKVLDFLVGKIHDFFAEQIRTSTIIALFDTLKAEAANSASSLIISAVLALTAGYSVMNTVRDRWSTPRLEGILALCAICVIIGIMANKWKVSLKNSFFVKLYHFLWE